MTVNLLAAARRLRLVSTLAGVLWLASLPAGLLTIAYYDSPDPRPLGWLFGLEIALGLIFLWVHGVAARSRGYLADLALSDDGQVLLTDAAGHQSCLTPEHVLAHQVSKRAPLTNLLLGGAREVTEIVMAAPEPRLVRCPGAIDPLPVDQTQAHDPPGRARGFLASDGTAPAWAGLFGLPAAIAVTIAGSASVLFAFSNKASALSIAGAIIVTLTALFAGIFLTSYGSGPAAAVVEPGRVILFPLFGGPKRVVLQAGPSRTLAWRSGFFAQDHRGASAWIRAGQSFIPWRFPGSRAVWDTLSSDPPPNAHRGP